MVNVRTGGSTRTRSRVPTLVLGVGAVVLLLTSSLLVAAAPTQLSHTNPPTRASVSPTTSYGWSVDALRSSSLTEVRDSEPGLALPGAITVGPVPGTPLLIVVTFPIQHTSGLDRFLSALSDPSSPLYHHYLTALAFDSDYGGNATAYAAAAAYFGSFGVANLRTAADRLTLTFQASPVEAAEIFGTAIDEFELNGHRYVAPAGSPRLPTLLASAISGVEGLSTYSTLLIRTDSSAAVIRTPPGNTPSTGTTASYLQPVTLGGVQYEYGPDFQIAYDELSLFQDSGYPTNAVIATILWAGTNSSGAAVGSYVPSDVLGFYNETLPSGEPHPKIHGVPLNGAVAPGRSASYDTTGANFENTLDLEMAGSTAPGASIYNVYGPNSSFANLDAAFSYVLNPTGSPGLANVSVITNSWGGTDTNDTTWFQDLQEAQARGISVLASSGDAADNPASSKWLGTNVEFPSSMAYNTFGDTAVGGTTVVLNSSTLTLRSQVTWNISASDTADGGPAGSSGGISSIFAEPSWQLDSSANVPLAGAGRGTPDVAGIANNTLVTISSAGYQYRASNATYGGPFDAAWGTSIASPLDAGIVAEIDHVLAAHSNAPLGFLNPQLYTLANAEYSPPGSGGNIGYVATGSYVSSLPSLPMSDVTVGANYVYSALPGYDLVTGWGSIDAYNYSMYFLNVASSGVPGRLSGVEDSLTLNNLGVTSYFEGGSVNTAYNASIQQNFFLANSLGAPVYWIQNVIYVTNTSEGWYMTDSGWVVYPFYGIYPSESLYAYNFPSGQYVTLPSTFDVKSVLETPPGFNAQYVTFSVGSHTVTLPTPGAAYIIGSLWYNYSWQGANYTNGPFPDNPTPGGLSPQFGLVGGPSAATGQFVRPTAGNLTARILPYGNSTFVPAATASFGPSVDETGENALNLAWIQQSADGWGLGIQAGSTTQGILSYEAPTSSYAVTFTETGLPTGTLWSVTTSGTTLSSTTATILFTAQNGSYPYTVGVPPGYIASPSSGTVMVAGAPVSAGIGFTSEVSYSVTLTEIGLPSGTSWTVTLGGSSETSTTSSIIFTEPPGTYAYSIISIPGYSTHYNGQVTVDNAPVSVSVEFTLVKYAVVFVESGLPSGTSWSVTLNETMVASTDSRISISEPNGTYPYLIDGVSGWHQLNLSYAGSVNVDGATLTLPTLKFAAVTYSVTFVEAGLPAGTHWPMSLAGPLGAGLVLWDTMNSTNSSIVFSGRANGSYAFQGDSVPGYIADRTAGTLSVSGESVTVAITFTLATYTVTFLQTGLPSGIAWWVNLTSGASFLSRGAQLSFPEPNGSYAYSVSSGNKTFAAAGGGFAVDGGNISQTVTFREVTFTITFTETGLPTGTLWYVNLTDASSFSSTIDTLILSEPNGTYLYAVATGAMYEPTTSSGGVTVAGDSVSQSIAFNGTFGITFDRPSGSPSGSTWTIYLNSTVASALNGAAVSPPGVNLVRTTTADSLTVAAPNGTYSYAITVSGSPSLTSRGSVTVQGSSVVANPPSPAPSTFLGFAGVTGYYILIAIVAVLAIGIGLLAIRRGRKRRSHP